MADDGEAVLAGQLLRSARSVLVIDWPGRDVPESLAWALYLVDVVAAIRRR